MLKSPGNTLKYKSLLDQLNLKYSSTKRPRWQGLLFSVVGLALTTGIMSNLHLELYNVNMIFMALTLVVTVWFGLATGSITAVLAFLCFNYFFIPPIYTFDIDASQGWTAVFLFFGTALFANQIAGRARLSSQQAQERAQEATALYELATAVITKVDQTEMLLIVLQQVSQTLGTANCTLFLRNEKSEGHLVEIARIESSEFQRTGILPHHPDPAMAQAAFNQNRPAFFAGQHETPADSRETAAVSFGPVAYVPLASGSQILGVMALVGHSHSHHLEFSPEEKRLIQVFANHVALAVEHARLIREAAQVAALRDSDKLKSSLLASVSHELRTPLTAIRTATTNLQAKDIEWDEEDRDEFLKLIEQETDRLTRLVSNVLDLSKIEAHALKPDFGWYFLPEIVEKVVERLKKSPVMYNHPVTTIFAPDLPLARLDYLQIDQVLTNLLENAAKYSSAGRAITVQAEIQEISQLKIAETQNLVGSSVRAELVVKVLDEGSGIPASELERIFDKFYRVRATPDGMVMTAPGTGIGLAISKGIIEAHGGQIWAQNRLYGGSVFTFTLPLLPFADPLLEIADEENISEAIAE